MNLLFAVFSSTIFALIKLDPLLVHAVGKTQLSAQPGAHCHAHTIVLQNASVDGVPVASIAKDD